MSRYEDVVFAQGDDANEPLKILDDEGEDAALEYLKQWHQPGNHMMRDKVGAGTSDRVYRSNGYHMSYNPRYGYIGLSYDTQADPEEEAQIIEDRNRQRAESTTRFRQQYEGEGLPGAGQPTRPKAPAPEPQIEQKAPPSYKHDPLDPEGTRGRFKNLEVDKSEKKMLTKHEIGHALLKKLAQFLTKGDVVPFPGNPSPAEPRALAQLSPGLRRRRWLLLSLAMGARCHMREPSSMTTRLICHLR